MLAPTRFASPANDVKLLSSQSTPAFRSKSLEFLKDKYSASSFRPADRALCSASASTAAQASSSSLMFTHAMARKGHKISVRLAADRRRWYHDRRIVPHWIGQCICYFECCPLSFLQVPHQRETHKR